MSQLSFTLPDGSIESVDVSALLNAGYAGRNQDEVASHIAELAALGVPAPTTTPRSTRSRRIWPSRPIGFTCNTVGPPAKPSGR